MSGECKGVFGRLFGHRFEARYSAGKPTYDTTTTSIFAAPFSSDLAGVIAASKPRAYRGDVCVRCGALVNEQDQSTTRNSARKD